VLERDDIRMVFDATGAAAHLANIERLRDAGKRVIDLTPAATGPYVIPGVNLYEHLDSPVVNLISCGAQATIPLVHAIRRAAALPYAEIVATIASRSAGPGTRQNIDEFTRTTGNGIVTVGGAERGKAIIVLNPADPPILMRDAIYARVGEYDREAMLQSINDAIAEVQRYVPGLPSAAGRRRAGDRDSDRRDRGRRRLPPAVCGEPRHHDLGSRARRRGAGGAAFRRRSGYGMSETAHTRTVQICDCSLRDGSNAIGHSLTPAQAAEIAARLDDAGVYAIEVGHGDGLAASSIH
jgi:hypothetical protein